MTDRKRKFNDDANENISASENLVDNPLAKKIKLNHTKLSIWSPLDNFIEPETLEISNIDNNQETLLDIQDNKYEPWVSPSNLKNYFLNDPILDWFRVMQFNDKKAINDQSQISNSEIYKSNISNNNNNLASSSNNNLLFTLGNEFEVKVFQSLQSRFPNECVQISPSAKNITIESINLTIEHLKKGTPIIYQAPLSDSDAKLRGCADLIIRSDWLPKIYKNHNFSLDDIKHGSQISSNFHYKIIDIKWTTLKLKSDGKHLLSQNLIPAYQAQLGIYNFLLGKIQGFYPSTAYIMGKGYNYTCKRSKYQSHSWWDKLGVVEFDHQLINKIKDSIIWVRTCRKFGNVWNVLPIPSRPELYPNMCNKYDHPFHGKKKRLADQLGELTNIWQVGYQQRRYAHSQGIYNWRDIRCNAATLGIKSTKIGHIINQIININKPSNQLNQNPNQSIQPGSCARKSDETNQPPSKIRKLEATNEMDTKIIMPDKITHNYHNWLNLLDVFPTRFINKLQSYNELEKIACLDYFLDFETIPTCFLEDSPDELNTSQYIFMIGLGFLEHQQWKFKSWVLTAIDPQQELQIILDMFQFIITRHQQIFGPSSNIMPRIFHWSQAELTNLKHLNNQHNQILTKYLNQVNFIDLYQVFYQEPIIIKGALGFSLKDVAKAMFHSGMIATCWDESSIITNGWDAVLSILPYFTDNKKESTEFKNIIHEIVKYNEIDCKTMSEIVTYIRTKNN